jgi:hypothetical protein
MSACPLCKKELVSGVCIEFNEELVYVCLDCSYGDLEAIHMKLKGE